MSDELSRGDFLGTASGGLVAAAALPAREVAAAAPAPVRLRMRWYGGGVYELATPDDSTIVLVDAWIWNNTGFERFGIPKPPELASSQAYVAHLLARKPSTLAIAITHDHGDHIGDYFELLSALDKAALRYGTAGQSDLFRVGFTEKFRAAGVDPAKAVLNGGAGMNFGGAGAYGATRLTLVPAVHSCSSGFPAAGFMIDIGGARVYASGDTDLFGDLAELGVRYAPDVAIVSAGNGAFTMGPEDAARASALVGATHAIPVHYAHDPRVLGPACAAVFERRMGALATSTVVATPKPGETVTLEIVPRRRPMRTSVI